MAANGFSPLLWVALIAVVVWFIWSCSNQKSDFVLLSPSFPNNQQDKYRCTWISHQNQCLPWLKKVTCDTYDITGANTYCATSDSDECRQIICSSPTGSPN